MAIEPFSRQWSSPFLPAVRQWLIDKPHHALVRGLAGSGDALVISDLFLASNRPVIVFTESGKRAETLCDECRTFLGDENVAAFPSRDAVPYNMKSPFGPTVETRFRVLRELLDGNKKVIVAPHVVLSQKIMAPKALFNRIVRMRPGDEVPLDKLCRWLTEIGFRRETLVTNLGTYCIRGGIIDLYPFLTENPVRVEYWGDTIDSIREFDVFTQKSLSSRTTVEIVPMREFCFSDNDIITALEKMAATAKVAGGDPLTVHRFEHQWKAMADLEGIEWFLHWFDVPSVSILDYCVPETLLVWDDLISPVRRLDETVQNYERHHARVPEILTPFVSKPHELLHREMITEQQLDRYDAVFFDTIDAPHDSTPYGLAFTEQPQLPQELDPLLSALTKYHNEGFRCVILSPNIGHAERMQDLLADACPFTEISLGFLNRGIIDREQRCLFFSENQIMNRAERPVKIKKRRSSIPIAGFDALSPHDFVVHEDHGIAKFLGVERVQTGSVHTDCMVLLFADNARVYVPIEDFHKVQKYIGKEAVSPVLSKIGTSSWERLKVRTRKSLKEMASELIELYAKRQFLEGISFAADTMWQKEFEDSFVYEETSDQLRAIQEVKADMEAKKPMDRLICGDVGFGKTEVAMRAAFKAAMSGYQVALLAPTTILAAQHYATFIERMRAFPVRIASLSRFLRPGEQKTVTQKIAAGEIDILIGTHRIFSADVKFKNLGLLIIDEEQRFGVRHKEKLKQLRYIIDVLSLTATPIPRTLHLSLVGARDLSIIATPPRNRLPVETSVAEYHDELIKHAVENEIERGGQIYFVNNRIKNLEAMRDKVLQLVPSARVVCAHGQMNEHELERIMKEFVAGRFDVLLSTVIIENGLDIPNVNTIIVNRADTMGLSQLYQLRGRVGRSSEQAYAFLLTPSFREVREDSLIRLRALEQYTELGSGFQIAMRDLEIRGAGNILGTRQHGFIAAIGFELYCRLLQDAVRELKGQKPAEKPPEVKLEIPIESYIPTDYIADGASRIEIYQELSAISTIASLTDIEKSMVDRFGPLPGSVISLLVLLRIKFAARAVGVSRVSINNSKELSLVFEGETDTVRKNVMSFMEASGVQFKVVTNPPIVVLVTTLTSSGKNEMAQEILALLQKPK
ncbi:MAG: transcription-repair coupling factor [Chitinispirillaceae bacterium]|jgi:transcription-repair coupling factor (superfamily II helicase)